MAYLESLGLRVKVMPNALATGSWTTPVEARVADLHEAFADPQIAAVICGIGGNHSNQLLPHLDYELIGAHPKLFQGYSDMTVLHWAFMKHARLATFYGPAAALELAEYPEVLPHTDRYLRAAWFGDDPVEVHPASHWTDEFLDWDVRADLERARALQPSDGWVTVREGRARGPLVGGCLETLCWHVKGSTEWLDLRGAIVFLETSEEAPSPAHVDAYLSDLENLGVFADIAGLIAARPYGYGDDDRARLWDVLAQRTESSGIPVLGNVECGHADPMVTLPMGRTAELDAGARTLRVRVS